MIHDPDPWLRFLSGAQWSELKECVYGGYHQFVLPKFPQDADVRPSGEFRQFWFEHQEQDVRDADPDYYARWQSQLEGAVKFLQGEGVKVHLPELMSDANMKYPRGEKSTTNSSCASRSFDDMVEPARNKRIGRCC